MDVMSLFRIRLVVAALGAGLITVVVPATTSAAPGPPVISEIMLNPASAEDDWEWIEIYNSGDQPLDFTGWVVDDNNGAAHPGANIAGGSIPADGTGILFNADDVTTADFAAAWGSGINLIPVTNWAAMQLNNGGDTIGLWSSFADYSGDNATQANTVLSVAYPGNLDDGAGSIHLTDLSDQNSFTLSADGVNTPAGVVYTSAASGGNSSADVGSPVPVPPPPPALFTQYVEGSGDNQAIEIANVGTAPLDLTGWALELYSNGSPTVTTSSTISGTISVGDVYVAYNPSAGSAIQTVGDEALTAVDWDGNDAIVLRDGAGAIVDSIGQVGVDPGAEWGDASIGTQDATMCRNDAVTTGDADATDVFDPSVEWTAFAVDDLRGLGATDCQPPPPPITPIHDIQGSGVTVALSGTQRVEAVVTSRFTRADELDGLFIQEEDADADADADTSEGIFVLCRAICPTGLVVGDLVDVTGDATDVFGMSQLDVTATGGLVTIVSSNNPLPTAVALTLPAPDGTDAEATYESVEGMIVTYPDTLVVSEYFQLGRFGQVVLTDAARPFQFTQANVPDPAGYATFLDELAARRINLDDDNNDQNDPISDGADEAYPYPVPGLDVTNFFRGGDAIDDLTAVMHWSFPGTGDNAWRLRPIQDPSVSYDFTAQNARPGLADVGGDFRVATMNVLNYFSTIDTDPSNDTGDCGPAANADCRGADSEAERIRQLDKIVAALVALDADVVGLVELENDTDDSTLTELVGALNAAQSTRTYGFVAAGAIGSDAIKVGFIYDTSTTSTVGNFAVLDSSVDARFDDSKNRPALIQTFAQTSNDARLTLAVNHLKSKGSDCDDVGDPNLDDGAGNCNLTRANAATALAEYLATDPTGSGDADVMILGDLNAYLREDPIARLQAAGYTDLVQSFEGPGAYGFVFDGQLGTLDYALANSALESQVAGATSWNINADEIKLFDYNDDVIDAGESSFQRESAVGELYASDVFWS